MEKTERLVQKLLQENATLNLQKMQLEVMVEELQEENQKLIGKGDEREDN